MELDVEVDCQNVFEFEILPVEFEFSQSLMHHSEIVRWSENDKDNVKDDKGIKRVWKHPHHKNGRHMCQGCGKWDHDLTIMLAHRNLCGKVFTSKEYPTGLWRTCLEDGCRRGPYNCYNALQKHYRVHHKERQVPMTGFDPLPSWGKLAVRKWNGKKGHEHNQY